MLPPKITPAAAAAKSKKLQQRVSGYLKAAEAVAKLTRKDPNDLKIRVLAGTSLWSQPSAAHTEEDPRAIHLALELIEMGRAVMRRSGLVKLFERARRVPGVWDVATESFKPSTMACLFQNAYLDFDEHCLQKPGYSYVRSTTLL